MYKNVGKIGSHLMDLLKRIFKWSLEIDAKYSIHVKLE